MKSYNQREGFDYISIDFKDLFLLISIYYITFFLNEIFNLDNLYVVEFEFINCSVFFNNLLADDFIVYLNIKYFELKIYIVEFFSKDCVKKLVILIINNNFIF